MAARLFIDHKECDLSGKEIIALSFAVNRLTDIESRQGFFSNTFKLPKTATNLQIFGHPEELNSTDTKRWERLEAWIDVDGVRVVYGFARLVDVGDTLSVVVKAANAEFVEDIQDKKLTDLNLSDLDHIVNESNVSANRFNDYTSGFVYPDIDYNFMRGFTVPFPFWFLYPAVFVRRLLEQIAIDAGYTLVGDVLNDSLLKKMIVPFSRRTRTTSGTFRNSQLFRAQLEPQTIVYTGLDSEPLSQQNEYITYFVGFNNDNTNGYFDTPGDFTTGAWTLFTVQINPASFYLASTIFTQTIRFECTFVVTDWTPGCRLSIVMAVGANDRFQNNRYRHEDGADSNGTFSIQLDIFQRHIPNYGNFVAVQLDGVTGPSYPDYPNAPTVQFLSGTMWNEPSEELNFSVPIDMGVNLPDMLQSDFLKYILNAFSLIIFTDKLNQTVTLAYLDSIPSNAPEDWTSKVDSSESPSVNPTYGNFLIHNTLKYSNNTSDESLKDGKSYAEYDIEKSTAPKGDKIIYKAPFSASRPLLDFPDKMFINLSVSKERTEREFTAAMTIVSFFATITIASTEGMAEKDTVVFKDLDAATTYNGALLQGQIGVEVYRVLNDTTFDIRGNIYIPSTTGTVMHMKDGSKTKDPKPRIAIHDVIDGDSGISAIQLIDGATVTQASRVSFTELEWTNLVFNYGNVLSAFIITPQQVSMLMRLSAIDINQLDFTRPKWLDQYGCYFYLSFVDQYKTNQVDSTEVELIKLP